MIRGQHSPFVMINVKTVIAKRRDHVKGLKVMADRRDTIFLRRGECVVDPDLKIGMAALLEKTTCGGRRGSGVLDHQDGRIQLFDVVNLLDDVGVLSHVDVDLGLINSWDMTLHARRLIGNGKASRAWSSATWSAVLTIILVCLMNGSPRIVLTVALGPTTTMNVVGFPSFVRYGSLNLKATVNSVVTYSPFC
jgi:hypothetical protein